MTERELIREVMRLCDHLGLLYHHCPNSSRCEGTKGLPDLIVLGERGLVLAELKAEDGNTTTGQALWLRTAARASWFGPFAVTPVVWRPSDLDSGRILSTLEVLV